MAKSNTAGSPTERSRRPGRNRHPGVGGHATTPGPASPCGRLVATRGGARRAGAPERAGRGSTAAARCPPAARAGACAPAAAGIADRIERRAQRHQQHGQTREVEQPVAGSHLLAGDALHAAQHRYVPAPRPPAARPTGTGQRSNYPTRERSHRPQISSRPRHALVHSPALTPGSSRAKESAAGRRSPPRDAPAAPSDRPPPCGRRPRRSVTQLSIASAGMKPSRDHASR